MNKDLNNSNEDLRSMEDAFEKDAREGIQDFKDNGKIDQLVESLNKDLMRRTALKNKRKAKWKLPDQSGLLLAVGITLALIVMAYLVIHKLKHP
jgi:hypothetical protein